MYLKTICTAVAGLALAVLLAGPTVGHADVRVDITADNAYRFGWGDANDLSNYSLAVETRLSGEIFSCASGPEIYNIPAADATAGNFLYIIAWADKSTTQGVLGKFQSDNNPPIYTGIGPWEVCATGIDYDPGGGGPPVATINAQIKVCNDGTGELATTSQGWVDAVGTAAGKLQVGEDNSTPGPRSRGNEFGLVCTDRVDTDARWMWFNWDPVNIVWPTSSRSPFIWPGGSGNVTKDFLIFRLPAEAVTLDDGGCVEDDFENDAVGAAWTLDDLGDATGSFVDETAGTLHLTGTGSELYHGTDNGAFLHQAVDGDFRVEVDITGESAVSTDVYRKGGLVVLESMDPLAPRVMINYLPEFPDPGSPGPALQFDARLSQAGIATELGSTVVGITLPVRLAVQRRGDDLAVYFSTDGGASWVNPLGGLGGQATIPMTGSVLAGLVVSSYDDTASMTMSFDDFSICAPDPTVPDPEILPCDADQPLDWVYLMDISGTMVNPHGAFINDERKVDSTGAALTALNQSLAALGDGSRAALVTYTGNADPAYNLAYGAQLVSGFTDDFDALAADLESATFSPINTSDTTPGAIGLAQVLDLLAAERDPTHGVVVAWTTDNLPNIDGEGRGPLAYADAELQAITLTDGFGDYLPVDFVAWQGNPNHAIGTFDGQSVADAMQGIIDLRDDQGDLRIFSLVPRGDGVDTPVLTEALLDFAAWYTQGGVHGGTSTAGLMAEVPALLTAVDCGQEGEATLSGTVWHDLNGDGIFDLGEPGLTGVTVTVGASTVVTGSDGRYTATAPSGSVSVSVDSADLPLGVDQPSADPDGTATAHTATLSVGPWDVVSGVDFGYAELPGGPLVGCEDDDFDDGGLDGAWSFAELGNADQGDVDESGGTLKLTGDGTTAYAGTDNGAFVYRGIEGDFRTEVDVLGFPVDAGGAYRKAGLMVREGLGDLDARIMVQYVPDFAGNGPALQFRARMVAGGPGDVALGSNQFGVSLPVRLAIERVGNTYSVQFSSDGGNTWINPAGGSGGTINADLGPEPLVGMNTVSYSAGTPLTAEFDNFTVCGEPAPPAVWTQWLDRDNPGGNADAEAISLHILEGRLDPSCANPLAIECQTTSGVDWTETGEVYTCNVTIGGDCRNAQQPDNRCLDYRVRFVCP